VNGALLEAFRHNSWATRQLLALRRDLSEEQLAASATGTYGSIRATFNHLVLSDGRYLRRLAGEAPAWVDRRDDVDLGQLAAWAEEAGQLWERLLSEWSSWTTGRWRSEPASSSPRRSTTGTPTGSRSAPS
jgi:uncharacterized damage-inducible protein DinB